MNDYDATEYAYKNGYAKGRIEFANELLNRIEIHKPKLDNYNPYYLIGRLQRQNEIVSIITELVGDK